MTRYRVMFCLNNGQTKSRILLAHNGESLEAKLECVTDIKDVISIELA